MAHARTVRRMSDTGDLTAAFVFLFVLVVVSFLAGYGLAYMRLVKRSRD